MAEELLAVRAQWLCEGLEGITALLLSEHIIAIELPAIRVANLTLHVKILGSVVGV